jgi:hypothetical protein
VDCHGPASGALRLSLALISLLGAAGCSHGSSNLAGHWRGLRAEGVRSDVVDTTNAYAAHMRFDVKGDVITVTTAKDTRTDHYSVVTEDKAHTVITTDQDGESDPQTFTFTDPKTMKWAVSPGASIVFTRE